MLKQLELAFVESNRWVFELGHDRRANESAIGLSEPGREFVAIGIREHSTKDGDAEHAPDLAEELARAGRDADELGRDGVLNDERHRRQDEPEAEPEDDDEGADVPLRRVYIEGAEQEHGESNEERAEDRLPLIAAETADDLAANDAGDEGGGALWRGDDAGGGRRGAEGHLHERPEILEGAEHAHAEGENDEVREQENAVLEEREREDRFGVLPLLEDEEGDTERGGAKQADDFERAPGELSATPNEGKEEGDGRRREERRAQKVELHLSPRGLGGKVEPDRGHRDEADGDVDVEDHAPAVAVGEEAAEGGAKEAGEAEGAGEEANVLAALHGREGIAKGREDRGEDDPAAEALDGAEGDERPHGRRRSACSRGNDEDQDPADEEEAAPVEVAELPDERDDDGGGEEV